MNETLRKHATPRQIVILDAIEKQGSHGKAARELGISRQSVDQAFRAVTKRAAKVDPALHNNDAPPGYRLKGVSTMRDAQGNKILEWVKTTKETESAQAIFENFKAAVAEDPPPVRAKIKAPSEPCIDLLTIYPMGDPHLGMLAWRAETGSDFDIKIAERNLCAAVDQLVGLAPASKQALIINLGDFFHADNSTARTPASGHALDVDSRWAKVLRVGIRTMAYCIDAALAKHESVRVICEIGNHDPHTAIMLAICLDHHYKNNPRVQIDTSPNPFHWLEFGRCLIGVTHGHNTKPDRLPGIMAHDQAEAWGRTTWRYWYTGHVHHESVKEYPGCKVETFNTLAPRDAWHNAQGYRADRSMVLDVLHRDRGRIKRHVVGIEEIEQAAALKDKDSHK